MELQRTVSNTSTNSSSSYAETDEEIFQRIAKRKMDSALRKLLKLNFEKTCMVDDEKEWIAPEKNGLDNSQPLIAPVFYKKCDSGLLKIDHLYMIQDRIRNLRSLSPAHFSFLETLSPDILIGLIAEYDTAMSTLISSLDL